MVSRLRRSLATAFFLLVCIAAPALAAPPIPALTGRVVDQAGILDRATIDAITQQTASYEAATGKQLVVVTLPSLQGFPIEDWGLALGRGWGIGQKGKNNGVLLIVAPNDRQLRIEVGYGLEGDLPDATANTIIQSEIIPYFKRNDMQGGVSAGVTAILGALGGSYRPTKLVSKPDHGLTFLSAGIFALVAFIFVMVIMNKNVTPNPHRRMRDDDDDGVSFSGGSSGGGFSGGGGSFGGGGASGRW